MCSEKGTEQRSSAGVELVPPQDGHDYFLATCKASDTGVVYPCWERMTMYMRAGEFEPAMGIGAFAAVMLVLFVIAFHRHKNLPVGE